LSEVEGQRTQKLYLARFAPYVFFVPFVVNFLEFVLRGEKYLANFQAAIVQLLLRLRNTGSNTFHTFAATISWPLAVG
jgi:hypothetical protein